MILILGTSSYEQGTNPVIDWLIHYKAAFIKITIEDLFTNFEDMIWYNDIRYHYCKHACICRRCNSYGRIF